MKEPTRLQFQMAKVNKGIYLCPVVRYELKKLACTYHVTLKSLIPAILLYIIDNVEHKCYESVCIPPGPKQLKNIIISNHVYDSLKLRAYEMNMKLNDFINVGIMAFVQNCNVERFLVSMRYTLKHTGKTDS